MTPPPNPRIAPRHPARIETAMIPNDIIMDRATTNLRFQLITETPRRTFLKTKQNFSDSILMISPKHKNSSKKRALRSPHLRLVQTGDIFSKMARKNLELYEKIPA